MNLLKKLIQKIDNYLFDEVEVDEFGREVVLSTPQGLNINTPMQKISKVERHEINKTDDKIYNILNKEPEDNNQSDTLTNKKTTVITGGTVITGNVSSTSPILLSGKIIGDMTTTESMKIDGGIVEGNVNSGDILLIEANIKGNVGSTKNVQIISKSIVNGDINGDSVTIDSTINGNIACVNRLVLKANAVVNGNIQTHSLSVEENAVINGNIQMK